MGEEIKFLAKLLVQDGLKSDNIPEMGLRYLIQVDVNEGRFFIDASSIVSRALADKLPISGEVWLDECNPEEPEEEKEKKN